MNQDQLTGLARHLLTTLGGILVAKGYLDEASMLTVVGALTAIAGVVWSVWIKRTAKVDGNDAAGA